jgi:hypothetical protein
MTKHRKTGGAVVACVFVDDCDAHLLTLEWTLTVNYGRLVARTKFVGPDGKLTSVALHRVVAEIRCSRPSPEHVFVEALNGNKLDCRASNLVWVKKEETHYLRSVAAGAPVGVNIRESSEAPFELPPDAGLGDDVAVLNQTVTRFKAERERGVNVVCKSARERNLAELRQQTRRRALVLKRVELDEAMEAGL